ncbi:MAG: site-specific integrase [Saccharofermentans sp.]|nr:site-specific integrase [Saccharofermentans sp.]
MIIQDDIDYSKLDSTINSYYEIWKQIKTGIRETTFATYICYYDRYIKPKFGKTKLRNVTYSSVVIFLKSLATEKGLRYASIRNVELSLSEVLDIAVKDEVLHSNPCKGALKELKREYGRKAKKVRALTLQEQKIFESYLAKPGHYHQYCPVFTVMLWIGMRVGETLGLRWEDIDFDNDEIDVNHLILNYSRGNGLGNANKINPPKTEGSNRIIPMLPKVKEAFKMEKERQELLGIKCRSVVDGYTNFIFIDNKGEVLDYKQLNHRLDNIRAAINKELRQNGNTDIEDFPHVHNHMLRHTFATRMREAGADMKAVSDLMGHEGILITLKTYTDASSEFKRREISALESYINNAV